MLYIRPNRVLDLPVGRVASGCLLDEFFSTVLSKNNVIRYSDALAEEEFCIGQTCRPEPCKPVVLTNPHPTDLPPKMCLKIYFPKKWRAVA